MLSNAPFGRFPEALARRRPRIRVEISLSFFNLVFHQRCPLRSITRTADFSKAQDGAPLAMCPSVAFSLHTHGCASKGRRLLSDAPFGLLFNFLFEKALFGRSLAQLILSALSIYPFGVKEYQERRFLSDVPFGRFCLYPSADFVASGASWLFWEVLGWILACWDPWGCNITFWVGFGASQAGVLPSVASCA